VPASCGTAIPNVEAKYLSLFGNCKPNDGINCGLGSLKDAKKTVSDSKGGFWDSLEQFMRRLFVIVTAMAAIATVSGCMGNANPGQNPRPGWTEWDRARDNDNRLARAGTEQHLLIAYTLETIPARH